MNIENLETSNTSRLIDHKNQSSRLGELDPTGEESRQQCQYSFWSHFTHELTKYIPPQFIENIVINKYTILLANKAR